MLNLENYPWYFDTLFNSAIFLTLYWATIWGSIKEMNTYKKENLSVFGGLVLVLLHRYLFAITVISSMLILDYGLLDKESTFIRVLIVALNLFFIITGAFSVIYVNAQKSEE